MTKAIFLLEKLDREKIDWIVKLKANTVFVSHKNLNGDFIKKLCERGIKICVEIGIFVGEGWWEEYPDCRPIRRDGKPMEKVDWYAGVCPNHPEVRKKKLVEIKSLVGKFDIDGVWLDFIRYPCHWEEVRNADIAEYCFCQNCVTGFKKVAKTPRGWPKVNGVEISPRKNPSSLGFPTRRVRELANGPNWIRWKCDQITGFVAETRTLINQSGKNIQLGMFSVPWKEEDFDGAIRRIIGQDFKSLAKYIDVLSPMTYQKFCGRDVEWIGEMVKYMAKTTGKSVLPIIQTEDRVDKISRKEFAEEIRQATSPPSSGVIIFFLEDLLKDKDKVAVAGELFAGS